MGLTVVTYRDAYFGEVSPLDKMLWKQVIDAFGVKFYFLDDETFTVDESLLVVFDENAETPLTEFKHPKDAIYLFGCAAMNNIHKQYPRATSVNIEVPKLVPNQGLFGSQAAAIVLYDRECKSWQQ